MADRIIEEHWVKCAADTMDDRLDTLRRRADHLALKIDRAPVHSRTFDERERAAIMWAIAELSGIGDEVRRANIDRERIGAGKYRKAVARADAAELLNAQYRATIKVLKAELYRLGAPRASATATDAVYDPENCGRCLHDPCICGT